MNDMDYSSQGRNLDKLLQPLILAILARNGEMHGFAFLKECGKISRFAEKGPDATGVYRNLKKMESDGLLTSRWEIGEVADTGREGGKPRRIFQITPEGKKVLSQWESALSDYEKYIHDLRDMICESI